MSHVFYSNFVFVDVLQVDVVCHGQTPIMPDTDGFDPYSVSCSPQLLNINYDFVSTEIES